MRHLEGVVPFFPTHPFPFFFLSFFLDKNMNADLGTKVTESLMNSCILGSTEEKCSIIALISPCILWGIVGVKGTGNFAPVQSLDVAD